MATEQRTGGGRIYQSQSQGDYQGSAQSLGFRPQQAANTERADRIRLEEIDRAQATQRRELERQQSADNTLLRAQQTNATGALKLQTDLDKNNLEMAQRAEKADLEIDQQYKKDSLELTQTYERNYLDMEQKLSMSQLRAEATVATAKTKLISDTISGILNFGNSYLAYNTEMDKIRKVQEAEQAVLDSGAWAFTTDYDIQLGGSSIIDREQTQVQVENLEEGIIANSSDDPFVQEELRSAAGADATTFRQQRQLSVGEATSQVGFRMQEAFYDPNTLVTLPDGRQIAPTAARNLSELNFAIRAVAQGVTKEFGASAYKDDYAAVKQYIPALEAAQNSLLSENRAKVLSGMQATRETTGFQNAAQTLSNTGDTATAWSQFYNAAWASGKYRGDQVAATKAAVEAFVEYASEGQIRDLASTRVYEGGPTFGTDRRFNKLLEEAVYNKERFRFQQMRQQNSVDALELSNAKNDFTSSLIDAGTDTSAIEQAHLNYEQVLREYADSGNAMAKLELTNQLSLPNNYSPENAAAFVGRIAAGDLPTEQELDDALRGNFITPEEYKSIKNRGVSTPTDFQERYGSKEQYRAANKSVEYIVESALAERLGYDAGVSDDALKEATGQISVDIIKRRDAAVQQFLQSPLGKEASPGDVIEWANRWVRDNVTELTKSITVSEEGALKGYRYQGMTWEPPTTGDIEQIKAQPFNSVFTRRTGYDYSSISAPGLKTLPKEDINITDYKYLTQSERNASIKAYTSGGSYPSSVLKKAQALGVTPDDLVRSQAALGGYRLGDRPQQPVEDVQAYNSSINDVERRALDVIGKYESDGAGSYNAVNQYGAKGGHSTGRELGFYSGDIRKMSQHGGRALTDMTIKEIMDLQYDDSSRSNAQWRDEGRLHAVGRYQFIGPTFASVVRQMGLNPSQKFTPETQDAMALWLLRNSSNGIGQWVGPNSYATQAERAAVRQARYMQRVSRNPNATDAQLRRARLGG